MVFRCTIEFTAEDSKLWQQAAIAEHAGLPASQPIRTHRAWRNAAVIAGLAISLAGLILVIEQVGNRGAAHPLAVLAVFAGMPLLAAGVRDRRQLTLERAAMALDQRSSEDLQLQGAYEVLIDRDGVQATSDDGEGTYRWSAFNSVREFGTFVILHGWEREAIVAIPKRLFGDQPAVDLFISTCRQWMIEGGGGERAFIARRLARQSPAPCVKCRYDLHALTAEVCPECGTPITMKDQPGLFVKQPIS
jgi:hypothetical protein